MVFNLKGGKKHKKKKRVVIDKKIIFRDDELNEEYGKVIKLLGNGRVYCKLRDGTEQLCIIPGRMKKKHIWVRLDSIILIAIRSYQLDKADIIHVYLPSQIDELKKQNELPLCFYENYSETKENEDLIFIGENDIFDKSSDNPNYKSNIIENDKDDDSIDMSDI